MANPSQFFDLTNRHALVTGAGRGLGFEIARGLASAGAHVWLNGRNAEALEERTDELRRAGYSASAAPFDVTDHAAAARWHRGLSVMPDILVNNATLRDRRPTAELSAEAVGRLVAVNATAAFSLTQALVPAMIARAWGRVVNITSIAGPRAGSGDPGYTLAKGGLEALTRSHAVEFGGHGICVNAVAPGFFATEANEDWVGNADVDAYLAARSPLQRWAKPHEIAGAVVFLCSDAASYVNGHVLVVDGGMSIKM